MATTPFNDPYQAQIFGYASSFVLIMISFIKKDAWLKKLSYCWLGLNAILTVFWLIFWR